MRTHFPHIFSNWIVVFVLLIAGAFNVQSLVLCHEPNGFVTIETTDGNGHCAPCPGSPGHSAGINRNNSSPVSNSGAAIKGSSCIDTQLSYFANRVTRTQLPEPQETLVTAHLIFSRWNFLLNNFRYSEAAEFSPVLLPSKSFEHHNTIVLLL